MPELIDRRDYIDKWRMILMFLGGISYMGLPSQYGLYVKIVLNFVSPAFFILSGYLVLLEVPDRHERILRTIGRTAIAFVLLSVCYFLSNLALDFNGTISTVKTGKFWFDFLVLNKFSLPIGGHLWYIQSLLYGYIILYFLDRIQLLEFDWFLIVPCFIFAFLTGDFAKVIGFHFAGYEYLMSNFLNRALPYILLGRIIHNAKYTSGIKAKTGGLLIFLGIALIAAEIGLLVTLGHFEYYGHLVGHIFISVGATMFIVIDEGCEFHSEVMQKFAVYGTRWIYYIAQPIYVIINYLVVSYALTDNQEFISGCSSIISLVLSAGLIMLVTSNIRPKDALQ